MPIQIRYMGSKRRFAGFVAEAISTLPKGPCLDLFSGMCSIGEALSTLQRQVWCNDVQQYAAIIAAAFLESNNPPSITQYATEFEAAYQSNLNELMNRFSHDLENEAKALASANSLKYRKIEQEWEDAIHLKLPLEVTSLRETPSSFPYRMATLVYSWGYFGLRQSLELDSSCPGACK
jgi:adenine-specific DNA-methyltransferase